MLAKTGRPSIRHIMKTTVFDSVLAAEAALATLDFLEGEGRQFGNVPGAYIFDMSTLCVEVEAYEYINKRTLLDKILGRNQPHKILTFRACAFGMINQYMRHKDPECEWLYANTGESHKIYHALDLKRHEVGRLLLGYLHTGKADFAAARD